MGVVGPAVDRQRGRPAGRGVRARARRLRPRRGPRRQGDRRPPRFRPARRRRGRALALRSCGRRGGGGGGGHAIDLVTSGWPGGAVQTVLDGLRVHRVGGRHTFALRARGAVRRLLAASRYDVVVEDINKLPLYLTQLTDLPFCVIVPHLFGTTAFAEASWPIATVVWAAERLIPRVDRRTATVPITDSTSQAPQRIGPP